MKRGEIYFADLDPIIPITSNVNKVYPFEVLLSIHESGLAKTSKAQCHQIRTISKSRISNKKVQGMVANSILTKITSALKLHLDLN